MIYLIPMLLMVVGIYLYDYRQQERGKILLWILLLIILVCIAGFRYRMGIDSIKYENYYHWQQHTLAELRADDFKDTRFAPGYVILSTICRTITYEFMLMQFVVSIAINSVVFYFFWKNTRHIFTAVLIYYFFLYLNLNMEVIREALAVSVFLLAWPFFRDGKWWAWYGMSILAFMFHLSAIFMFVLPVICLPGVKWLFQFGTRSIFVCIGILVLGYAVNYLFFDFIKLIAFTENMAERAEVYSKTDLGGNKLNIMGIIIHLILYVIYPLTALYFVAKSRNEKDERWRKFEMMVLMSVYISILNIPIEIFTRYKNYFGFFSFVIMADWFFSILTVNYKKVRLGALSWYLILVPLLGIRFYSGMLGNFNKSGSIKNYNMYYPYSNVFDQEIDPQREKAISYSRRL